VKRAAEDSGPQFFHSNLYFSCPEYSCRGFSSVEVGATHPPPSNPPHPSTLKENEFPRVVEIQDDSIEDV